MCVWGGGISARGSRDTKTNPHPRNLSHELKQIRAASEVQRLVRGFLVRTQKAQEKATRNIQRVYRGHSGRTEYLKRAALLRFLTKKSVAATKIAKAFRKRKLRRSALQEWNLLQVSEWDARSRWVKQIDVRTKDIFFLDIEKGITRKGSEFREVLRKAFAIDGHPWTVRILLNSERVMINVKQFHSERDGSVDKDLGKRLILTADQDAEVKLLLKQCCRKAACDEICERIVDRIDVIEGEHGVESIRLVPLKATLPPVRSRGSMKVQVVSLVK